MSKKIEKVIYEMASKNSMLKVKANAFGIEKVQCTFLQFDAASKKRLAAIEIYLSFAEALRLANDLLSGKIPKAAAAEKAKGEQYPKAVWQSRLGGINEEAAAKRNLRSDGKAISRNFSISAGSKAPFVLTAEQRPGKTDAKGLIVPEHGKPELIVRVPATADQLKELALTVQSFINGFIASQFACGGYDSTYEKGV